MRHLLPASCTQFPATVNYSSKDKPNLTASISASSTTSTNFSALSASSSLLKLFEREQNPHYAPITVYALSQTALRKRGPLGQFEVKPTAR